MKSTSELDESSSYPGFRGAMQPLTEGEAQFVAHLFPHGKPIKEFQVGKQLVAPASIVLDKLGIKHRAYAVGQEVRFVLHASP